MTRAECEDKLLTLAKQICDVYEEYRGNTGYLSITVLEDYININNGYWGEDKELPVNISTLFEWRNKEGLKQ